MCLPLFCYALVCVHSSFAIILKSKRKLVVLLLLSYRCIATINVLWLFFALRWVGLQCVIVVFPDHTHFFIALFQSQRSCKTNLSLCMNWIVILWISQKHLPEFHSGGYYTNYIIMRQEGPSITGSTLSSLGASNKYFRWPSLRLTYWAA